MRTRKKNSDGLYGKMRAVGIGVSVALLTLAVCLTLTALIMTLLDVPPMAVTVLSVLSAMVSALIGGFTASRVAGKEGWLMGLLVGGILLAVIFVTGIFLYRNIRVGFLFIKLAALLLGGMVGGIVGVK